MSKLFQRAFQLAHHIFNSGTCLEFGVYVGNTYLWQAENILRYYPDSKLVGFDSWVGLPEETSGIWRPDRHAAGCFASNKDVIVEKLNTSTKRTTDQRFRFIDGFFSESLNDAARGTIDNVIFVNIDVDIYKSTVELLDFVKPLLRPGVVLYWDDWKDPCDDHSRPWGQHLAWEQWSFNNPDITTETIEVNPVNQRTMVVMSANGITAADTGFSIIEARQAAYRACNQQDTQDTDYERFLRLKDRFRKLPFSRLSRKILRVLAK